MWPFYAITVLCLCHLRTAAPTTQGASHSRQVFMQMHYRVAILVMHFGWVGSNLGSCRKRVISIQANCVTLYISWAGIMLRDEWSPPLAVVSELFDSTSMIIFNSQLLCAILKGFLASTVLAKIACTRFNEVCSWSASNSMNKPHQTLYKPFSQAQ